VLWHVCTIVWKEKELSRRQAYCSSWSDEKNLAEYSDDVLKVCWSTVGRLFTASRYRNEFLFCRPDCRYHSRWLFKECVYFLCNKEGLTGVRDLFGTMKGVQRLQEYSIFWECLEEYSIFGSVCRSTAMFWSVYRSTVLSGNICRSTAMFWSVYKSRELFGESTGVQQCLGASAGVQRCFGASPGFCVGLQAVNRQVVSLYCTLHKENSVYGELSEDLGVVLRKAVEVPNVREVSPLKRKTIRRPRSGSTACHTEYRDCHQDHTLPRSRCFIQRAFTTDITCFLHATPIAGGY
jgi:hypothetical protein